LRGILIVSGGLDSTTMAYSAHDEFPSDDMLMLSFNYGQRHAVQELALAGETARHLGMKHTIIDMSFMQPLMKSALTDTSVDVPEGHYAHDTMKATVVPNRNALMLNIGIAAAVTYGAEFVATGVHAGDHDVYPDCRPEFIASQQRTALIANEGFIREGFRIIAPYLNKTKTDIAVDAGHLNVPLHKTWSCYKGGAIHCGRCSTCVERLEAIYEAGLSHVDETPYEDEEYWKEVVSV
jgi:7-cyano-7-deazaguanine synthase